MMNAYQDPFSPRVEEIARQGILRADSLGMKHYGPAPTPLEEKRDMYQEAIEELLDAILLPDQAGGEIGGHLRADYDGFLRDSG